MITPDHATWSAFVSDLQEFFAEHTAKGVMVDAALCGHFADGLHDLFEATAALEALATASGHLLEARRAAAAELPPRGSVARRALVRSAAPLSDDGRVVALPVFRAAPASGQAIDGGAA